MRGWAVVLVLGCLLAVGAAVALQPEAEAGGVNREDRLEHTVKSQQERIRGLVNQRRDARTEARELRGELRKLRRASYIYQSPRFATWMTISKCECAHWRCSGYFDGGLQMDTQFQQTYGADFMARWGHAGNWPISAQMHAADRAVDSGRGYHPWPTCARRAGLIA